jgi:hypothetical protein
MEPWYKVREGRSFNPDEFAITLGQVVDGTAPEDYKKPGFWGLGLAITHFQNNNAGRHNIWLHP